MTSSQQITTKEDEDCLKAILFATSTVLPFALKTAVDLELFEIIAKSDSKVSATEIVSKLSANNPNASNVVDRVLRFLTTQSILNCDLVADQDGNTTRVYGISSIGKYFLRNEDGISLIPMLNLTMDKHLIECWNFLKEATLEGGISFERAFGDDVFAMVAKDKNLANVFNQSMSCHTSIVMKKVLEIYTGFEGITQVIDVGGGFGTTLKLIVSKYPQIKGINFDLPHVVKDAPNIPGVEHVGGDMFNKILKGEIIFMKWILHDWGDEECLKLLRNCNEAISESGKVIILESILPELPTSDIVSTTTLNLDVGIMHLLPSAKERTFKEFETLAIQAGFSALKPVCRAYNQWIMELYKNVNTSIRFDTYLI